MNEIVDRLKKSVEYREEYGMKEDKFKEIIKNYFYNKYGIAAKVYVWGNNFGVEKDLYIAHANPSSPLNIEYSRRTRQFDFTIDVLYKFCKDFDAEFLHTACDGSRYVFYFKNVDLKKAIW